MSCGVVVACEVEQVCSYGVDAVVFEVQGGQFGERGVRAVDHGDGDDAVEGDHGAGCGDGEQVVEAEDLFPVGVVRGGGFGVDGGDGGLELVGADLGGAQGVLDECGAFGDGVVVPAGAVLFGEGDEGAVGVGAGGAAGVGEEHEGEQSGEFAVVGAGAVECSGEADGLGGEVDADEVVAGGGGGAFGEDQVEDVQDRGEVFRWAEAGS